MMRIKPCTALYPYHDPCDRDVTSSRQDDGRVLFARAVEQDRVAEDLRDLARRARRQRLGRLVAIERRGVEQLDLDQLVIGEGAIDGVDEGVGDAGLAEVGDRRERV